ncbi:protein kinase domain-containing protein [Ditylenchus destructor]|nr:protein kinase domain-containing protein [Ditylenchus destructor]
MRVSARSQGAHIIEENEPPARPRAREAPRNALQQGVEKVRQANGQLRPANKAADRIPERRTPGVKTPPTTPDDFELTNKVFGEGSFGKVIEVVHKVKRKKYAMKIMKDVTEIREIVIGRHLKIYPRCPYLMNFVAFDSSDWKTSVTDQVVPHKNAKGESEIRIVMEIMDVDLLKLLTMFSSFTENLARVLMIQVAFMDTLSTAFPLIEAPLLLGLKHLHKIGIIHRDVKAENTLMKFRSARLWLTDFGLSTIAKESSTFAGTVTYMAPEIAAQETYGPEVDFWSAGVLLYEMVASQDPFAEIESFDKVLQKTLNVKNGADTFAFPKHVAISKECKDVIKRLMEPDRSKRVGTKGGVDEILNMEFFKQIDPELMKRVEDENDLMIDFMVAELNESVKKAKYDRARLKGMSRKSDASRPMQDITNKPPQNPVTPQAKPQLVTPAQKKPAPHPVTPARSPPANSPFNQPELKAFDYQKFMQEQESARRWDEARQRAQEIAIREARLRHAQHIRAQEAAQEYAKRYRAAVAAGQPPFWLQQNIPAGYAAYYTPGYAPNYPPGNAPVIPGRY